MSGHPPEPTLFPYTTLFRSRRAAPSSMTRPRSNRDRRETRFEARDRSRRAARRRSSPTRAGARGPSIERAHRTMEDRKSTRLNSSHRCISYAVFCLKKKHGWMRRVLENVYADSALGETDGNERHQSVCRLAGAVADGGLSHELCHERAHTRATGH